MRRFITLVLGVSWAFSGCAKGVFEVSYTSSVDGATEDVHEQYGVEAGISKDARASLDGSDPTTNADSHVEDDAEISPTIDTIATVDSSSDTTGTATETCDWTKSWTLSAPELLQTLNSATIEAEPYLSSDGLTIYFSSLRSGNSDGYIATRSSRTAPFSQPVPHTEINTSDEETRIAFAPDRLTAYLAANRPGGTGASDIWIATRKAITAPLQFQLLENVNTTDSEWDPHPSNDGIRLYFAAWEPPQGKGNQELLIATRSSSNSSDVIEFSPPQLLTELNTAYSEDNPVLTQDERVIVFGSDRTGSLGSKDLWYATRTNINSPFGKPERLPVVNSTYQEGEAFISADGCELFFISTRPGGQGDWDLYRSVFIQTQ